MEANKEIVRRYMEEAWNQGKVEVLDELFTPELAASIKPTILAFRSAFPDWHCTIHAFVAEGDLVTNRWSGLATHQGELFGIPPTGKQVHLKGITIHQIQNNKIVADWSEADQLGMMQQLGVIPSQG